MTQLAQVSPIRPDSASKATRILIVEDSPVARKILHRRIEKSGYEVEVAEDGQIGWEKAQSFRPDIILSDWMMPNMDGPELCALVKAHPDFQSTYFILLTAKDSNEDKVAALDTGADEYLVKPCEPTELLARVRAAERIVALQNNLAQQNAALEKAMERINHELKVTSEIQLSLLPQKLLEMPGYDFGAYYRPSTECSGDYYDLIQVSDTRFAFIMADVSGHGTPAMVAMAQTRSLVHLCTDADVSPADLLEKVNRLLYHHLPTSQFVTCFFGVCDTETGQVQYSSAGHNPPLLIRGASGEASYLDHCEGFPLKLVTPDAEYDDHEIWLEPGDALLLYTDGIPEGADAEHEQFDSDRLMAAALEGPTDDPDSLLGGVMTRLLEFTAGCPLNDDVSMLFVGRKARS